ncbi:RNA polymerase sigma factor SigJ [Rhodobacteraceae bacterium B1Z28]|uniref:RNA polymerase sigma factor SigJ n=1 Tax=Ruegeria haliotis TaxID=2747601 RepID=A0ABX2PRZ2_9RHOB|nr:RNA polymerase sigma factor SigJ [Ruegeria haliotis]NVO56938.1 RNA polymerase sigma factor SigJ [Ruegeria haliotis]
MTDKTIIFEEARPRLLGLAYRLLGSVSDAQDVVQDTYLKWMGQQGALDKPMAWLRRVCTNACLDHLKSAHRRRVDYVGPWIPDHIQTEFSPSAETQTELASSLTTAFLLLLERLTPKERAAYLLHDIFAMSFGEVSDILDMQPAACRKLASRARRFVGESDTRHAPPKDRQEELLAAFQRALSTGDTSQLGKMLRDDSNLRADSGGAVVAARDVIEGRTDVCRFVAQVLQSSWRDMRIDTVEINGGLGLRVRDGASLHATVSFGYDRQGNASHVFIMRNPDKLLGFQRSSAIVWDCHRPYS